MASKTEQAMDGLAAMIRSGRYRVGEKLPTEPELVDELGVSRTAVREAVRALSFAGVVRVRQGDGTYVTALEPMQLLASTRFVLDFSSPRTLAELYAVRRVLESEATGLAATHMTPDRLASLRSHLATMRSARDAESFVRADAAFHDEVAAAAGNEALRALLASLRSESSIMHIRRAREDQSATSRTVAEHEAILAALESGDAGAASAAARGHLAEGEKWLLALVQRDERATA